jgi:hypothetical protein
MPRVVYIWTSDESGTSRRRPRWCSLIILLAICTLAVNVATRSFLHSAHHHKTGVTSVSPQGMRQHLDRDAVNWSRPSPVLAVFDAPAFYPRIAPAGPPLPSIFFDESLSNRPPPSC